MDEKEKLKLYSLDSKIKERERGLCDGNRKGKKKKRKRISNFVVIGKCNEIQ